MRQLAAVVILGVGWLHDRLDPVQYADKRPTLGVSSDEDLREAVVGAEDSSAPSVGGHWVWRDVVPTDSSAAGGP